MSPERRTRNPEREQAQEIKWAELMEEALSQLHVDFYAYIFIINPRYVRSR